MNNARDAEASREEEIAFLIVEAVIGVQVTLVDAGGGDLVPDGQWVDGEKVSVIEVTSPPSVEVMRAFATAARGGRPFVEEGDAPAHLGTLAEHLTDLVTQTLARDVEKLGWSRHEVRIAERALPGPGIVAAPAPEGWRSLARRT